MKEYRLQLALLGLAALLGLWVRLFGLGSAPLSAEELPYHFAASAVSAGGEATLPSGQQIFGGQPMVSAISAAQSIFDDREVAARLPSALLGIVALLTFGALAWLLAGPWAAVMSTALMAFYPEAVAQARTAGLHSFQLLCGVVALGAGWLATVRATSNTGSNPVDLLRRWGWAAVTVLALFLASLAHLHAFVVFVAFALWVAALAAAAFWLRRARALVDNVPLQLVVAGLLAGFAVLILRPSLLVALLQKAATVPQLHGATDGGIWFYADALARHYGWVFTLLPLIGLFVVRSHGWLTVYLLIWLLVPLLSHSLLIARKEERLLLMATPAMFLLAGVAFAEIQARLYRAVEVTLREWHISYRRALRAAGTATLGVAAFAVLSLPAVRESFSLTRPGDRGATAQNWSMVAALAEANTQPIGAAYPLEALYHIGRVRFGLGTGLAEIALPAATTDSAGDGDSAPLLDWSTGVPLASTSKTIAAHFPETELLLLFSLEDIESGRVADELREQLIESGSELCRGSCGPLRLYRWRPTR